MIGFGTSPGKTHSAYVRGETVRKVKHSSVRIENPLSALYRGTEYFGLARTFRTACGGGAGQALSCFVGVASTSEEIAVLEVKA